ncbi:thioesterase domain-containing protein [Shewanella sp. SR44-3]|uniref:thioesterase domain-containing protein n=1 Tax=unclassified Shewanella TaxID=196818 RepID=UPI0038575449
MDPLTQAWLAQLQQTWHQTIPVSQFMQITPNDFNGTRFTAIAPLAPNINLHHTMFAGSIYTLMTLTGWGMVWLQQKRQGITADIVLADGKIKYHAPVTEAPVSQVMWPAPTKAQLDSQIESQAIERSILNSDFTDLYRCNKMSHHLEVHLYSGKTLCATFNGRYVSLKKPI